MRCFFSGIILELTWVRCVSVLILGSQIYLAEGLDQIIPYKQYCLWHLQSSDLWRRGCHFCRLNPSNVAGGHCRFVLTEMSSATPVIGHYCVCPGDISLIGVLKLWERSSKWFIGLTYFSFTFTIVLKDSVTGCAVTSPQLLINCELFICSEAPSTSYTHPGSSGAGNTICNTMLSLMALVHSYEFLWAMCSPRRRQIWRLRYLSALSLLLCRVRNI